MRLFTVGDISLVGVEWGVVGVGWDKVEKRVRVRLGVVGVEGSVVSTLGWGGWGIGMGWKDG